MIIERNVLFSIVTRLESTIWNTEHLLLASVTLSDDVTTIIGHNALEDPETVTS